MHAVGIESRDDFYWTLHAVFVNRRDQRELFDQAFHIFWRNPQLLERMMRHDAARHRARRSPKGEEMNRRLAEALKSPGSAGDGPEREQKQEIELDAAMTFSEREVLRKMDFEKMSTEEIGQAKNAIKRMSAAARRPADAALPPRSARRPRRHARDLARAAALGRAASSLKRKRAPRRPPPLVILCDISGSMSRYSRLFLHFMHAVTNDRDRVYTFLFGTRLTNITRYLRYKDIDVALDNVAGAVDDWSGGTRIGHCLADFNRNWSRRVLGQGAVVLLITDGLDRDAGSGYRQGDGAAAQILPPADLAQPAVAL